MKQKSYEAKYNVDLVQDQDTGKTKFVQREKDELQLEQEKLKAKKLEKKGIIVKSKEDKRKEKRLKEKEKRMKKKRRAFKQINEDFDNTPEEVAFNEIGKKHALKKYDQFTLNTSCFWGSTGSNITLVVQFRENFYFPLYI